LNRKHIGITAGVRREGGSPAREGELTDRYEPLVQADIVLCLYSYTHSNYSSVFRHVSWLCQLSLC